MNKTEKVNSLLKSIKKLEKVRDELKGVSNVGR